MSFTIKMVWNGDWCGIDTWLTFSIGMSLSTCTCQLPLFSFTNNIFQLSLLFWTKNYSWKGLGNVIGKKGFSSNGIKESIVDATIKLPPTMVVEGQVVKSHQFG
jgi:hypothetical protein